MAELTDDLIKKIEKTSADVADIKVALKGYDGQSGLIATVNETCKRLNRVEITVAAIVGTGILGGGTIGLIKLIGG